MKIKVFFLIPTMDRGGAEKQLTLLTERLPKDEFSLRVGLLTRGGPLKDRLEAAGVPVIEFRKRGKVDPFAYRRLVRELNDFRPHVFHSWLFAANAYGRLAASRSKVPVVFGGERCVDPWKRSYELAIDRFLAGRSQGIVTNSRGVVEFYAARGIPREKFHVIPNGVRIEPDAHGDATRQRILDQLGLQEPVRLVAAVGRLWPQKRHKDLIWAAELVNAVRDDVHLLIVGDGPDRWRLERYARQIPIDHRVHFMGARSDAALLIGACDQFWLGSGYEGQSNALLEAMAAGTPVIASDIPGNRDLVEHEKCGLLYPVGDRAGLARGCLRMFDSTDFAESLAKAAAERVRTEFTVQAMVDRHVDLYRRSCREVGALR